MDEKLEIHQAVKELLDIVRQLHECYPQKKFTLDGRLVGDIGEILVSQDYDVELYDGLEKHHDGISSEGRKVQIKTTMKDSLTFPCDHVPDYYIGIKVFEDGSYEEIYNGEGNIIFNSLKNRKNSKTNLHSVSINSLRKLNTLALPESRIRKRKARTI